MSVKTMKEEKAASKANKRKNKIKIRKWRGMLAAYQPLTRKVVFVVITIISTALTFTQLGFAGIGLPGQYIAYTISLLMPIALASATLGFGRGALTGLISGIILMIHSMVLPLDYFELMFVTPFSSLVQLAISGLLCDWLFALVLRKQRHPAIYFFLILLASLVVSTLYSIGFAVNAFAVTVATIASSETVRAASEAATAAGTTTLDSATSEYIAYQAFTMWVQVGDVFIQIIVDALLMTLSVVIVQLVVFFQSKHEGRYSIRMVFNTWLAVVVASMFMIAASICFAGATFVEINMAQRSANNELDYIEAQIDSWTTKVTAFSDMLVRHPIKKDDEEISQEDLETLKTVTDINNIFDGYDVQDDGYMFVYLADGEYIFLSDFDQPPTKEEPDEAPRLSDTFPEDVIKAIKTSAEKGTFERTRFAKFGDESEQITLPGEEGPVNLITSDLAYVTAHKNNDDGYVYVNIKPASEVHENRTYAMFFLTAAIFLVLIAIFALTTNLLERVISRKLKGINSSLEQITSGNLDATADEHETIEFDSLSNDINKTVSTLKGWIHEAESRMDAELATAKAIQESALPSVFPPFPDILKFDIYASMSAAKEVGGDFYDFFLVGEDSDPKQGKICFLIADVSGKGIPAALFMMNAKALVKSYVESGMSLGDAIENANRQLCEGNDEGMFVTLFAGLLDYKTNHVDFVNAGHNPPLLWKHNEGWQWLTEKSGLPLGLFDGMPYEMFSVDCQIGEQFLLYTDGVTEAMDVNGNLYGEDRLKALADESYLFHPRALVTAVRNDVAKHAEGAVQSDDITILSIEVGVPPEVTATLRIPAQRKNLDEVNSFIHTELDKRFCSIKVQNQIDIAVEEMFVNICKYAYPEATEENPGSVVVSYAYSAEPPSIEIGLVDSGIPYNPLEKEDASTVDAYDEIIDVPIGGLGIFLAKQNVDDMKYERVDNTNVLTMVKHW